MENEIPTAVSTQIDEETGRALVIIEKKLEIKPAAVARLGLKKIIPELLRRVKSESAK